MRFEKPDTQRLQRSLSRDVAIVVIALAVLIVTSVTLARAQEKAERQKQYNLYIFKTLEHVANHYLKDMEFELDRIKEDTYFLKEFSKKSRDTLYAHIKPQFDLLKKKYPELEFLHIHQADGRSLLRTHHPQKFGDEIAKLRPMLQDIHKKRQKIHGFETGIFANVYRVIVPVFDRSGSESEFSHKYHRENNIYARHLFCKRGYAKPL